MMAMNNCARFIILTLSAMWLNVFFVSAGFATTSNFPLENIKFTQDQASLQRGAKIYYDVCRLCHSLKYIKYKVLQEIGFTKEQVDLLRGDIPISASLSKTSSDKMLNSQYGQVPPDLSLMAKARKHGPQYIYTLLTTYSEKEGVYENAVFPGIKMPDALNVANAIDESLKQEIKSKAKDVTEFLLWSSDPRAAVRKTIGTYVVIYFLILSVMLYFIMKRVWSRLDKEK